ncbi:MAG: TlpA disulfide reductase family protein [Actinomycetes bacterium]
MRFRFKAIAALIMGVLLSSCGGGGTSSTQESFVAGNGSVTFINPDKRVEAPTLSGMTLSGINYKFDIGQVAVINVWASWCSPCRAEAPTLAALAKKYTDVAFMGILTRDNPATAEAFQRRFALPYPTLIDDSLLIGFKGSLQANAIPSTVVIDRKGRVAARISGEITVASLTDLIERVSAE